MKQTHGKAASVNGVKLLISYVDKLASDCLIAIGRLSETEIFSNI